MLSLSLVSVAPFSAFVVSTLLSVVFAVFSLVLGGFVSAVLKNINTIKYSIRNAFQMVSYYIWCSSVIIIYAIQTAANEVRSTIFKNFQCLIP